MQKGASDVGRGIAGVGSGTQFPFKRPSPGRGRRPRAFAHWHLPAVPVGRNQFQVGEWGLSIEQYVAEEHVQIARRAKLECGRLRALLGIMHREELAAREHVVTLAKELDRMHGTNDFCDCQTMVEPTAKHISGMLEIEPSDAALGSPY